MNNPRLTGLLLLLIGVLVLVGNTLDVFPPQAFWAGLLMYPIGGYLFFIGSRRETANAGRRSTRSLDSRGDSSRADGQGRATSTGEAPRPVQTFGSISQEIVAAARKPVEAPASAPAPVVPTRTDATGAQPGGMADQLAKLSKLHEQGIISSEELAVAKAKLRG